MDHYISVIIPAFNEEERIASTIDGIIAYDEIDEIIIVNDGSSDNTTEVVRSIDSEKVRLIDQKVNKGKGEALNIGLKSINKRSDIVGFLDADLGTSSSEAIKLISPIIDGECDVTIAKFKPATKKGGLGFVKRLARDSVYELTGETLTSSLSGQRFFKKEVLEIFDSIPYGYGVEVGMTVDIIKGGFSIKEVLVDMTHNETGRDISGFLHRLKQYIHIKKIVREKKKQG